MVLAGEILDEPFGKTRARPAVQMQHGLLRDILAHAVPLQGRLPADVKPGYLPLKHDETWMQLERLARPAVDAPCQALEPPRSGIVDRKVRRDTHLRELRRRHRRPAGKAGVEVI